MLFASACLIITLIIVGFIVLFTVDERPSDSAKVNEHLTSLLPTSNHTFRGFTRFLSIKRPNLSGITFPEGQVEFHPSKEHFQWMGKKTAEEKAFTLRCEGSYHQRPRIFPKNLSNL